LLRCSGVTTVIGFDFLMFVGGWWLGLRLGLFYDELEGLIERYFQHSHSTTYV